MTRRSWFCDEPGIAAMVRDGVMLLGAGCTRPWPSALVALVLAALMLSATLLMGGVRAPRYVMRVVEMDREPGTAPRPRRQLAEYVREALLTRPVLERVMLEHGLYSRLVQQNPQAAVESFREDIEVESYQNYFVEERGPTDAPRTARLAISFRSKDRAVAVAVTRELGRLVVEQERERRRREATTAVRDADVVLDRTLRSLTERRRSVIRQRLAIDSEARPHPMKQVELVSLLGSLDAREQQVEAAEKRRSQLDLALAAEQRGVGLSFEVVDDGELPVATPLSMRPLAKRALTFFLLALPLALLAVGAFANEKRGEP